MIIADKILYLRKEANLSQEELAERLNVSRQSVSKWESAHSIPDIDKIIILAEYFSVSTDFLLKDDIELEKNSSIEIERDESLRQVTLQEATGFIAAKIQQSKVISFAVALFILSPTLLIFLSGLFDSGKIKMSENMLTAIGLTWLFVFIAIAVAFTIYSTSFLTDYRYLEESEFELAFAVADTVKKEQKLYLQKSLTKLIFGIVLMILSVLPVIIVVSLDMEEYMLGSCIVLQLLLLSLAISLAISYVFEKSAYEILLSENEYEKERMTLKRKLKFVDDIFWTLVVTVYLAWSFISFDWGRSWIIFPIAAVFSSCIHLVYGVFKKS